MLDNRKTVMTDFDTGWIRTGGSWAKFAQGVDPTAAVRQALTSKGAVFASNPQPGTFRVITDLGYAVGSRGQTGLRVVLDVSGRIITAFPVKP